MNIFRKISGNIFNDEITFKSPQITWELQEKEEFSVRDGNDPLSEFAPPKYYLEMVIWDIINGKKAIIKNPSGMVLQNEDVKVKINKASRFALWAKGESSGIVVKEGRDPKSDRHISNNKIHIGGRIVDYVPIEFMERKRKAPRITDLDKAYVEKMLYGKPISYYHRFIYNKIILHKFVIQTPDNKFYAVDYIGELHDQINENDEIVILKGKVDNINNFIIAKEIEVNHVKIPKKLKFPIINKEFNKCTVIRGQVIDVKNLTASDNDYRDFLFKSRLSSSYKNILEQLYKECSVESYSKDFQLPHFSMIIRDENQKDITLYFRPSWVDENNMIPSIIPVPVFNVGDEILAEYEYIKENNYGIVKVINNLSLKCCGYSIIDIDNTELNKKFELYSIADFKFIEQYACFEIEGTISGNINEYYLGFDYKKTAGFLFKIIDVNYLSQVTFPFRISDNRFIAVKATHNIFKYGNTNINEGMSPVKYESNQKIKIRFSNIINGIVIANSIYKL